MIKKGQVRRGSLQKKTVWTKCCNRCGEYYISKTKYSKICNKCYLPGNNKRGLNFAKQIISKN